MSRILACILACLAVPAAGAQNPVLQYAFNEGGGSATANGGTGGAPVAQVFGHSLSAPGSTGTTGLGGAGSASSPSYLRLDTQWTTDLPAGFTVSFWIDSLPAGSPQSLDAVVYSDASLPGLEAACDRNTLAFRTPGLSTHRLAGGTGIAGPCHVAFRYDAAAGLSSTWLNGVLRSERVQPTGVSVLGSGDAFVIGGKQSQPARSLKTGQTIDDFHLFDTPLPEPQILALAAAPGTLAPAIFQTNQPGARMTVDGERASRLLPAITLTPVGAQRILEFGSDYGGTPFELGFTTFGLLPLGAGGGQFPDGQIVNINLADQYLTFFHGMSQGTPYQGVLGASPLSVQVPFSILTAARLTGQGVWLVPSAPLGFTISQAFEVRSRDCSLYSESGTGTPPGFGNLPNGWQSTGTGTWFALDTQLLPDGPMGDRTTGSGIYFFGPGSVNPGGTYEISFGPVPASSLAGANSISFYYQCAGPHPGVLSFDASANGGPFAPLSSWNYDTGLRWMPAVVSLPAYSGTVAFRIRYQVPAAPFPNGIAIDDVSACVQ